MIKDTLELSFLPLGGDDDPRVRLMLDNGVPREIMPEVWLNAMRVQCQMQNAAFNLVSDAGGPDKVGKDRGAGLIIAIAIGLGLGARNLGLTANDFAGMVSVAAAIANDVARRENGIRELAEANGHSPQEKRLN